MVIKAEEMELLMIYRRLNPENQETLLKTARYLEDKQEVLPLLEKAEASKRSRVVQFQRS